MRTPRFRAKGRTVEKRDRGGKWWWVFTCRNGRDAAAAARGLRLLDDLRESQRIARSVSREVSRSERRWGLVPEG